jgi:hypothetical protein
VIVPLPSVVKIKEKLNLLMLEGATAFQIADERHVAQMAEKRNSCKLLAGDPNE